jgi:hypothetical protein
MQPDQFCQDYRDDRSQPRSTRYDWLRRPGILKALERTLIRMRCDWAILPLFMEWNGRTLI